MRLVLVAIALTAWAAPALAACNSDLLSVVDWKIGESKISLLPYAIEATVTYNGDRPFRMIHAGVMLDDVLGRNLGQVNLDEDQKASPGDTVLVDGQVSASKRLGEINRSDVVSRACVWSIVYDDGTVAKFD